MIAISTACAGTGTAAGAVEVAIVYPAGVNWYYEQLAADLASELVSQGVAAAAVSAAAVVEAPPRVEWLLVVNLTESQFSVGAAGASLPDRLRAMAPNRILFNYDSIHTDWFRRQLAAAPGLFTHIVDFCMLRQTQENRLAGLAYHWLPETLTAAQTASARRPRGERLLPWTMLGHHTLHRAAFVDELIQTFGPNGFVFLPPLRPYRQSGTSLDGDRLARVLKGTDIYPWRSHHGFPYHEGLRVPQALAAGAIPMKIDVFHAAAFSDLPWVFPSLDAARQVLDDEGKDAFQQRCRALMLGRGLLGENIARLLREL